VTKRDVDSDGEWVAHRIFSQCPVAADGELPDVVELDDPDFGHLYLACSQAASAQVYLDSGLSRSASDRASARRLNGHMSTSGNPMLEGAEHSRVRRLLAPSLTSAEMERLRPGVREIVEGMVSGMEREGGPADLVLHLARPLPARVLALLFDLQDPDVEGLTRWAETILAVEGITDAQVSEATRGIAGVALSMWRKGKTHATPGSFTGRLLAELGTGRDTRMDFVNRVADLIVGACENTMVFIQTALVGLLSGQGLGFLRDRPDLVPDAVEELLRVHPPGLMGLLRRAETDTEIMGHPVPAGASVIPMVTTANRDPRVFAEPDAFTLPRQPGKVMTFGVGRHYCPGAAMARLEMQVVLEVLSRRWPAMRLAVPREQLERRSGHMVDGYRAIPVSW
jgi:cytochrome P450